MIRVYQVSQRAFSYVRQLNLFPSVPPSNDPLVLRNERFSTRLFIFLLILSTTILTSYISLINISESIEVKRPTFRQYSQLSIIHSQSLICHCLHISINYVQFTRIQHTMHQVCSSVFVTDQWIQYFISSRVTTLVREDFRLSGMSAFQALRGFCQIATRTVSDILTQFSLIQYVSSTLTSEQLFRSQIRTVFDQLLISTINKLLLSLQIIRDITHVNAFWSARNTNFLLFFRPNTTSMRLALYLYPDCSCALSSFCIDDSVIVDNLLHPVFWVPGVYRGCLITEALLQSDLQCFYDSTCIQQLQSYFNSSSPIFPALDPSLFSRYNITTTIQELINQSMVERWNLSITHQNYYDQCQPVACTYTIVTRNHAIYIVTTVFGLVGGLVTILKLIIPRLVKYVTQNQTMETSTAR